MNKQQKYNAASFFFLGVACCGVTLSLLHNSTECPQGQENNIKIEKQLEENQLTIKQLGDDYVELWEENQIFSSMLSEIENEPGGHEILKTLYDKHK